MEQVDQECFILRQFIGWWDHALDLSGMVTANHKDPMEHFAGGQLMNPKQGWFGSLFPIAFWICHLELVEKMSEWVQEMADP